MLERERERERQTDRQTDRQRERERDRQTDRERDRQTDRERERERERERQRDLFLRSFPKGNISFHIQQSEQNVLLWHVDKCHLEVNSVCIDWRKSE